MMNFKSLTALLAFLLITVSLVSQDTKQIVEYFKQQDKDGRAGLEKYETILSIELNKSQPKAVETEIKDYIALKANVSLGGYLIYDATSEVGKIQLREGTSKRYSNVIMDCGDYTQNGIFYHDSKVCQYGMRFSNVGDRAGTLSEKTYNDLRYVTAFFFPSGYHTKERSLQFRIPDWADIELKEFNFEGYKITKKITQEKEYKVVTYTASDLKKFANERNSPGASHIYPHVVVITKSYTVGGKTTNLFTSTDHLYSWYSSLVKQIGNNSTPLKAKVIELTKDATSDIEKVRNIFYWVQANIRYIAFEDGIAGFKPEACQNVYSKKYGDCKGMANLTKEMLVLAGFDARLTWIGTREKAYDYSLPSLIVDNHMICTVILNGKKVYLDATEKYVSIDDYAERIQGRQVMIEDGDKYLLEKVPVIPYSHNAIKVKKHLILKDNLLAGEVNSEYTGESRTNILRSYEGIESSKKSRALENFLKDGNKNLRVSDIQTSDLEERDLPIKFDYKIEIENMVSDFNNEVYVDIDPYKEFVAFTFDSTRTTDYWFHHKTFITYDIELELPVGYKVKHIPSGFNKSTDKYSFIATYKQKGNKIIYTKEIHIKNSAISKGEFDAWNATIKELKNKVYDDLIILTKS